MNTLNDQQTDAWHLAPDDEWLPAIGKECEFTCGSTWDKCEFIGRRSNGSIVIVNHHGDYKEYHPHQIKFRPIKTQAENRREMSIGDLASDIGSMGVQYFNDPWAAATKLHDAGYIKPKPLTNSVTEQIVIKYEQLSIYELAKKIDSYIRGELDL